MKNNKNAPKSSVFSSIKIFPYLFLLCVSLSVNFAHAAWHTVTTSAPSSANSGSAFNVAANHGHTAGSCGNWLDVRTYGGCSGLCDSDRGCSGNGSCIATVTMSPTNITECRVQYRSGATAYSARETNQYTKHNQIATITGAPASSFTNAANVTLGYTALTHSGIDVKAVAGNTVSGWSNSGSTSSCTVNGSGVVTIGATDGTCRITVTLSGNTNIAATTGVVQWNVIKVSQSINITVAAPASRAYLGTFSVTANSTSGLAVSIASSGGCSGSGTGTATITMNSGTTACTVTYTQAGNSTYYAAPTLSSITTASRLAQTINVTTAPASAALGLSFNVASNATSGLPVAITVSSAGLCSVTSGGSDTAIITANSRIPAPLILTSPVMPTIMQRRRLPGQ
jgi:hypothetical protein